MQRGAGDPRTGRLRRDARSLQGDGQCDSVILADLHTALEGKARFIVFGSIQDDHTERSEKESEDEKAKTKSKTMTTSRTSSVRLRFYDLSDQRLVWDHLTVGQSSISKEHDMTDIIKHSRKEGFLGGLLTSVANSAMKPDPTHPPTPGLEKSLANAFDNVGEYLKPRKHE